MKPFVVNRMYYKILEITINATFRFFQLDVFINFIKAQMAGQ